MTRETTTWTPAEASLVGDSWDALALARSGQGDPYATPRLVRRLGACRAVGVDPGGGPRRARRRSAGRDLAARAAARHVELDQRRQRPPHQAGARDRSGPRGRGRPRGAGPAPRHPPPPAARAALARSRHRAAAVGAASPRLRGGRVDGRQRQRGPGGRQRGVREDVPQAGVLRPVPRASGHAVLGRRDPTAYGSGAGALAEGLELLDVVQARSWKGPHQPATARRRRLFLEAADRHGWVQLLVLTIAGRPAAGNVWFRLGDVAVGWSTCYDQQLAALAPGRLLHLRVQEAVRDEAPTLLDVLPGPNPVQGLPRRRANATADRRGPPGGGAAGGGAHDQVGATPRAAPAVRAAADRVTALRRREQRTGLARAPHGRAGVTTAGRGPPRWTTLAADPAFARYLAVARGLPSAEAAASGWGPDDRWLLVGGDRALARLEPAPGDWPETVREVVPLIAGVTAAEVAQAVADALRRAGHLDGAAARCRDPPPLPWVPGLAAPAGGAG